MNRSFKSDTKGLINQACKHKLPEIMWLCNEIHRVIKVPLWWYQPFSIQLNGQNIVPMQKHLFMAM